MDFLEVRRKPVLAGFLSLLLEHLAIADDMIYGRAQIMAKLMKITPLIRKGGFVEVRPDQREQLASPLANAFQIGLERSWNIRILHEHLAIAQDLVDRGAEVVADAGKIE